jgi:polyisoprenoid-binding protein YceI
MNATLDATRTTQTYAIDKMHSEVAFQVRHLLTKVRGRFTEFAGTVSFDLAHPEQSSASLTIDASSIDTGTADRDTHPVGRFLRAGTYPTLTFTELRGSSRQATTCDVAGTLTILVASPGRSRCRFSTGAGERSMGQRAAGFEASMTPQSEGLRPHMEHGARNGWCPGGRRGADQPVDPGYRAIGGKPSL